MRSATRRPLSTPELRGAIGPSNPGLLSASRDLIQTAARECWAGRLASNSLIPAFSLRQIDG